MIDPMETRVSTRGRVTIPVEIRRRLGLRPGTRLIVREAQGPHRGDDDGELCEIAARRVEGQGDDGEIEGGEKERGGVLIFENIALETQA